MHRILPSSPHRHADPPGAGSTQSLLAGAASDRRRGFLLPLVILGLLAIAFFVMFVQTMSSSYLDQVWHQDEVLRCRALAESVYGQVVARIRSKPYKERFFSPTPYSATNVPEDGGTYNVYLTDTPGKPDHADLYVETTFGKVRRLYFYRIKNERSILDSAGRMVPLLFVTFPPENFTQPTNGSPMATTVNDIIETRRRNQKKADTKVAAIRQEPDLTGVLDAMNGPKDGTVTATDPVTIEPPVLPPEPPAATLTQVLFSDDFESFTTGKFPSTFKLKGGTPGDPGAPTVETQGGSKGMFLYDPTQIAYVTLPHRLINFQKVVIQLRMKVLTGVTFTDPARISLFNENLTATIFSGGPTKRNSLAADREIVITLDYANQKLEATCKDGAAAQQLLASGQLPTNQGPDAPIVLGFSGPSPATLTRSGADVPYQILDDIKVTGETGGRN